MNNSALSDFDRRALAHTLKVATRLGLKIDGPIGTLCTIADELPNGRGELHGPKVARRIGISTGHLKRHLKLLDERGAVARKEITGRGRVYEIGQCLLCKIRPGRECASGARSECAPGALSSPTSNRTRACAPAPRENQPFFQSHRWNQNHHHQQQPPGDDAMGGGGRLRECDRESQPVLGVDDPTLQWTDEQRAVETFLRGRGCKSPTAIAGVVTTYTLGYVKWASADVGKVGGGILIKHIRHPQNYHRWQAVQARRLTVAASAPTQDLDPVASDAAAPLPPPQIDCDEATRPIVESLRQRIGDNKTRMWLGHSQVRMANDVIEIKTQDRFTCQWLKGHFSADIAAAAFTTLNRLIDVAINHAPPEPEPATL